MMRLGGAKVFRGHIDGDIIADAGSEIISCIIKGNVRVEKGARVNTNQIHGDLTVEADAEVERNIVRGNVRWDVAHANEENKERPTDPERLDNRLLWMQGQLNRITEVQVKTAETLEQVVKEIRANDERVGRPTEPPDDTVRAITFEEAWQKMADRGYRYGKEALEQVRFGWEIAIEAGVVAVVPTDAAVNQLTDNIDKLRTAYEQKRFRHPNLTGGARAWEETADAVLLAAREWWSAGPNVENLRRLKTAVEAHFPECRESVGRPTREDWTCKYCLGANVSTLKNCSACDQSRD